MPATSRANPDPHPQEVEVEPVVTLHRPPGPAHNAGWNSSGELLSALHPLPATGSAVNGLAVMLAGRAADGQWHEVMRSRPQSPHGALTASSDGGPVASALHGLAESDIQSITEAMVTAVGQGRAGRCAVTRGAHASSEDALEVDILPMRSVDGGPLCALLFRPAPRNEPPQHGPEPDLESRETALQAAAIGVIEYDAGRRAIRMDAAAAIHHGLPASRHELLDLDTWLGLFRREDQLTTYALVTAGVPAGQTERITVRLPSLDPKKNRVLEIAFRSRPSDQRLIGASRNVTRERSLEELRRQKLSAERASQAKSEFMSQVSHELRTPLNAVLGFAQMMELDKANPFPPAHRERLDVIQHSGRRLLGLIDQLLQIGKIEQGKKTLTPKLVDVEVLIKRCTDALKVAAKARKVSIELDIEHRRAPSLRADPDALEQVLTNLLSNAIKYNRRQGKVRVRYRANEDGEISVDDTGKGLTDTQQARLFEPFNRLGADKSQVPGTGLGLVITRKLVKAMGGRLEVWSQVGKGSKFTVHLPLGRRGRCATSETLPLDLPSQGNTGTAQKVLYVEDDDVNLVLMDQIFATQPDWKLVTASTGGEGISAALMHFPQLILLDMNLPDLSGAEVFRRLRTDRRTRHIPCVAVSADALPEQIARAEAMGFDDYWTKPLNLPVTVGKLKKLLQ